jgi:N-ethylmaleimide reductase
MSHTELQLLKPYQLGPFQLKNRMVMAPMTRSRAPEMIPTDLMAEYYKQRATAGLIITEATQTNVVGIGYPWTPGIFTEEQAQGWQKVVNAVHEAKGIIFLQIFHEGRIAHPTLNGGVTPLAPSAVKPNGQTFTGTGMEDLVEPKEMSLEQIQQTIKDFRNSFELAKKAGFDGVEVHGANGYLIDQFLADGINKRTDAYGGSLENRFRFLKEVTEEAIDVFGSGRVGIRLSPYGRFNDHSDSNPQEHFKYFLEKLNDLDLAYVHLNGAMTPLDGLKNYGTGDVATDFAGFYKGEVIVCGGYDKTSAETAIFDKKADLVAFGNLYLANPDLPQRFMTDAPLNQADSNTFYGGNEKGYTDYPFLEEAKV